MPEPNHLLPVSQGIRKSIYFTKQSFTTKSGRFYKKLMFLFLLRNGQSE
ncbi:hypothetical protein NIES2104_20920 [Leptolyngbya sp. NIES-2104]|nr:hypothetical protein NIES2104_20920 [Leptolyngbya sp. NIES-2104]